MYYIIIIIIIIIHHVSGPKNIASFNHPALKYYIYYHLSFHLSLLTACNFNSLLY